MVATSSRFELPTSRDDLVFAAKLAEQAERYDEMVLCMKAVVLDNAKLSQEERNLLSVAYKNSVGIRRASLRILRSIEEKEDQKVTKYTCKVKDYGNLVEQELSDTCEDIIDLLEHHVLVQCDSDDRAYFKRLQGDYHRYLAEATADQKHKEHAQKAYTDAMEIAKSNLSSAHPIYLGYVLSMCVFRYDILRETGPAFALAKSTFDEAVQELENLPEPEYKEATIILQLLRDNLTLWSEDEANAQA